MAGVKPGGTWRPVELAREATAWSGPRPLLLALVTVVVLCGVGLVTSLFAYRALDEEERRRDAGGLVWEALGPEGVPLDASVCDGLIRTRGVDAAGGVLVDQPSGLVLFDGGRSIPTVYVTAGAVEVWTDEVLPAGILLGNDLRALQSVEVGSSLLDPDNLARVSVAGSLPEKVATPVLRSNLVVRAAPVGGVARCWVRMDQSAFDVGSDVLGAAFAGSGAVIRPYLRVGVGPSPAERWREFVGLAPWAAGALLIALASGLMVWSRRPELAIYRTFGTTGSQLWLMLAIESIAIHLISIATSLALTTAGTAIIRRSAIHGDVLAASWGQVLATAFVSMAIAPALSLLLLRGSVVEQLKDR